MGSILSKLFGGGNHHHGNAQPPPPASPATQPSVSRSTSSTSKPTTSAIKDGSPPPAPSSVKPAPINILQVEVDEEAFKESSPTVYTSTIKAHIDPSPPHPLEQYTQKTQVHLTTIETPKPQQVQTQAPIATIDSDYEDEIALLENQEIEDAVIKIQAGVRGFLVRKQIHANKSQAPIKSTSIDNQMSMSQQQENILPPPENFDTFASLGKPSLPMAIQSKRVETPIPGSPFAQDDTDYTILDSVDPQEAGEEAPMISNPEELEIFKKINEINQLLASKDEDEIEIVPEPPKTLSAQINAAFSSTSINNALNELDQTIREQEMTLPPETDEEVLVIEPAFADSVVSATNRAIDNVIDSIISATPQSPSVLVKAPSLEEESENYLEPDALWLSEDAAAIRIQAAFRGYEVRKSLSREMSPARSFEEEQKPQEKIKIDEPELKPQVTESLSLEPVVLEPVAEQKPEAIIEPEIEIKKSEEPRQPKFEPAPKLIHEPQTTDIETIEALAELSSRPVQEKLISVTELFDQEIIQDPDCATKASVASEPQPEMPVAQPIVEPIELQPIELQTGPLVNIAVKDGFGTIASSVEEVVVAPPMVKEKNVTVTPMLDIEKSIKELEKSFDRDLLADITSEVALPAEPTGKPVEKEETSLISIEPPTPGVQLLAQAPSFISAEPLLPSKIPVLDRASKSILKEPSSPEPHTYSNLALPSCTSPLSDTTSLDGGNDSDDEAESNTPSPIPLRASSPSPFKKRPRRHRGGKKK